MSRRPLAQPTKGIVKRIIATIDLAELLEYAFTRTLHLLSHFLTTLLLQEPEEDLGEQLKERKEPAGHHRLPKFSPSGMRAMILSLMECSPPIQSMSQRGPFWTA